jgi:glutaredoxin 3
MNDVTIFTKPGCPYCAAAKDDLQRRGIRYTEHNVKADADALRQMLDQNGGQRRVPTIVEGGQVKVGFNGY